MTTRKPKICSHGQFRGGGGGLKPWKNHEPFPSYPKYNISKKRLTQTTKTFIRRSTLVLLKVVLPQFCISFVSWPVHKKHTSHKCNKNPMWNYKCVARFYFQIPVTPFSPANSTSPKHQSVFLSVQPLSRIFSLSREYLWPLKVSVPLKRSSRLLGDSQQTSPKPTRCFFRRRN